MHPITHSPRMVTISAQRRERRRWLAVGVVLFTSPFVACLCVLGLVR